jgi:hypothetical protein
MGKANCNIFVAQHEEALRVATLSMDKVFSEASVDFDSWREYEK